MLGVKKQAGQLQALRLNGSQLSGSRTVFFGGRQKKVHLGGSHSLTANSSESFSGPHDQHSVVPAGTELHMQVPDRRIAMFIVATYVYCLDSPCCTFSPCGPLGLVIKRPGRGVHKSATQGMVSLFCVLLSATLATTHVLCTLQFPASCAHVQLADLFGRLDPSLLQASGENSAFVICWCSLCQLCQRKNPHLATPGFSEL